MSLNASVKNSTNTPLGAGAVFTGVAETIPLSGSIFVNVYTDVASATNGLSIQQSSDGTNWDHLDHYTINAGAAKNFAINPHSLYLRVVYTNGDSAQTAFRLQTIVKDTNAIPSSHRIQDSITDDDDSRLVKSVLSAKSGDTFVNIAATPSQNLRVTDAENGLAIAKGEVAGTSFIHKFGKAPDFDATDGVVTVWDGANDSTVAQMLYVYSSSADIDSISSSNAGDAQTVEIQGLDTNYDVVTQTATLNGQTRVALATSLRRVFRMKNTDSTDFAGQVYCYVNTAITGGVPNDTTKIRAAVDNGNNQTLMALYTIPNGKTGYLRDLFAGTAGANKNSNYTVQLFVRPFGGVFQLKYDSSLSDNGSSYFQHVYQEPEIISEKSDVEMRVSVLASGATQAAVSGGFDIVLVDN